MCKVRKGVICGILGMIMAFVCVVSMTPTTVLAASGTISGGYDTRATAYVWGSYVDTKNISVNLPEKQDDIWISFTLTKGQRIYARCTYDTSYEGMFLEMIDSNNVRLDRESSPDEVHGIDTRTPFLAVNCDNDTSSTRTYYIHIGRGTATGDLPVIITLRNRIKTGSGTFSFSGTASNPGNSALSANGTESSILTLDLTNNDSIPPNAIVTSVSTSGTQSPKQSGVWHMLLPATQTTNWYTANIASATNGSYTIGESDGLDARQVWRFKYKVTPTAKSTMRNVSMLLHWTYDLNDTDYKIQ